MRPKDPVNPGRHRFLRAAAGVAQGSIPLAARVTAAAKPDTKIGGSGGALRVEAGHQVLFSSRDLDEVNEPIVGLWPKPPAGSPRKAANEPARSRRRLQRLGHHA